MKLYDTPLAPNPRRVRWFLAEKGVADLPIVQGEHRTPEHLARAGLPNVPVLELDNGTHITESVAICRYLESRYPEPNMFGRTPEETAVIEMWTRRAELLVAIPLMQYVRHTHPALAALETPDPAFAARCLKSGESGLKVLDRRLAESEWIAANRITIADIVAFAGIDFGRLVKYRPSQDMANLARWAEAMRARPAARAGGPGGA